jgi:hypothetical protein
MVGCGANISETGFETGFVTVSLSANLTSILPGGSLILTATGATQEAFYSIEIFEAT